MEKLTYDDLCRLDRFLDLADERLKCEGGFLGTNPLARVTGVLVDYCRKLIAYHEERLGRSDEYWSFPGPSFWQGVITRSSEALPATGVTHTHEFTEESQTGSGMRCKICLMPERLEQQRPELNWAELSRHKKNCPIRRGEKECNC